MSVSEQQDTLKTVQRRAEKRLAAVQPSIRAYVPAIVRNMALTYLPAFTVLVVVSAVLPRLLLNFLPDSTSAIITWGANLMILLYGLRYLEKRYRGTTLFTLYTQYSKQRRTLEKALAESQDAELLSASLQSLETAVDQLMKTLQEAGARPSQS